MIVGYIRNVVCNIFLRQQNLVELESSLQYCNYLLVVVKYKSQASSLTNQLQQ